MSESSFDASSANSGPGLQVPGKDALKQQHLVDDDDDEEALDAPGHGLSHGVFGVVYTVSRERTVTWTFVAAKLLLDAWQLFMLVFSPRLGYTVDQTSTWWRIVSVISLNDFMSARGLPFFLACLYTFVALLALTLGLCCWVAYSFKNKRFDHVWPITFLRAFGIVFFQLLDVASMTFFLITLDCQYFGVPSEALYHNQEFPDQYCWSMGFAIHAVVAAISLLVYVLLGALFQMGEMDLNMRTRNPLGMAHSSVEVQGLLLRFVMSCAATFLTSQWMSGVITGCMLVLLYLSVKWVPYYHAWMNHVRSAVYGAVLYSAGVTMLLVFKPGVDPDNEDAVYSWRLGCTIACLVGLVPAGLLAAGASHLRLKYALHGVARKFREAPVGTKSHLLHRFGHPLAVEIAARCCRVWVDEDTLHEGAVAVAGRIIKAGLQQLPSSPFMTILHASYLLDVAGSYQSGLLELRAAKKADTSFLERFAIFCREQQHLQRASGARGANGADLVSYVEQQRDMRLALRVHKEALLATSMFWKTLVHPIVKLEKLAAAVAAFDEAVKQADRGYRAVLQRNSDNWKLQRLYAVFLENVRCDPWSASKWRAEAERLFQAEEDDKHNSVLLEASDLDDPNGPLASCSQMLKAAMADANRGVILMNAHCLMTAVNKATCEVLGYSKKQLIGKNINILLPNPFAKMHDSFVANYIRTGVSSRILDKTSRLVLLHRDQYIVPISIHIAKVSGSGMDSLFMGVFEVTPTPEDSACVWVMANGAIMSSDHTFSDWFAHQARDIANTYLHGLVADPKALIQAFKAAHKQERLYELGDVRMRGSGVWGSTDGLRVAAAAGSVADLSSPDDALSLKVLLKHKYAGALPCDITITNGGGEGNRHFFSIAITRPPALKSMLVFERKGGRLLHVSADVADALGYPLPLLLGDMASTAWDVLLPEPFCQLHRAHFAQDTPAQLTSHTAPSPVSCRSGLSVCLSTMTVNGLELQPFRLQLETRRAPEGGDAYCVAHVEKRSMSEALDERRLVVLLDECGTVSSVSGSPQALFGFDPERMLGRSIAEFVNVFSPPEEGLVEDLLQDDLSVGSSDYLQETLLELAIRSMSAPCNSYRVGVTAPAEVQVDHMASGHRRGVLAHAIAAHIAAECMHPAVMQVKVHLGTLARNASRPREHSVSAAIQMRTLKSLASGERVTPQECSASLPTEDDKEGGHAGLEALPPAARPASRSATRTVSQARKGGLKLELHLWRVDMLAGVLQVDRTGRITGTSPVPLHPPGLLLGNDKLVGLDIGAILPPMRHRPLSHLFLPDFGASAASAAPKAKGGLKSEKKNVSVRERKPGAVNIASTCHLADGMPLELTAQAVWGWGAGKEIHIILTAHEPSTGIPNFRDWLKANPVSTKQSSSQRQIDFIRPGEVHDSKIPSRDPSGYPYGAASPAPATLIIPAEDVEPSETAAVKRGSTYGSATDLSVALGPKVVVDASDLLADALADADALDAALEKLQSEAGVEKLPSERVATRTRSSELVHKSSSLTKSVGFPRGAAPVEGTELPGQVQVRAQRSAERIHDWVKMSGSSRMARGARSSSLTRPGAQPWKPQSPFDRIRRPSMDLSDNGSEAGQDVQAVRALAFYKAQTVSRELVADEDDAFHALGDLPAAVKPDAKLDGGQAAEAATTQRPSEDGSGIESSTEGDQGSQADYRRGRRFKRLTRMLTGEAARRNLRHFKLKAWGAAAFVMIATVACFTVMFLLLRQQQAGVEVLNSVGRSGVKAGQIQMALVACDMLIRGRFVSDLPGLRSFSDLGPSCLAALTRNAEDLLNLHAASYYTVMSRPDVHGLHAMWNQPTINCTAYEDGEASGDVLAIPTKRSLWDLGNMYGMGALQLAQNLVEHNRTTPVDVHWRNWSHPLLLSNNSERIYDGLYSSLDGLVQVVIELAEDVNKVQYDLVAVEGCVCSLLVIVWAFAITTKMTLARWWLYNTFMVIPVSLLKALAKKTAAFEDLVLLEMEGDAAPHHEAATMEAAHGSQDQGLVRFNTSNIASARILSLKGAVKQWLSSLAFWRRRAMVSPVYTKRRLVRSHASAAWLSLPFLCWGIMIIAINVSGHSTLESVSGPIAIFNLVNFVTVEFYRTIALTEDMFQHSDPGEVARLRDLLVSSYKMPTYYSAMLLGREAVPNETSSHYTLAKTGVAFSGSDGPEVLYHTRSCLRDNQSTCLKPDHPLYPVTVKGLDALFQRFLTAMQAVLQLDVGEVLQNHEDIPQFSVIWNIKEDIEGGLNRLNQGFFNHVTEVYQQVLVLHVIALVLSALLMLVFVFFMLKPYLRQLTNEARRIAELLSQLPTDVDVESLVRRAQNNNAIEVASAMAKEETNVTMSQNSVTFAQSSKQ